MITSVALWQFRWAHRPRFLPLSALSTCTMYWGCDGHLRIISMWFIPDSIKAPSAHLLSHEYDLGSQIGMSSCLLVIEKFLGSGTVLLSLCIKNKYQTNIKQKWKTIYIPITEICAGLLSEREVLNICSLVKSEAQRKNMYNLKLLRVDSICFKQLD